MSRESKETEAEFAQAGQVSSLDDIMEIQHLRDQVEQLQTSISEIKLKTLEADEKIVILREPTTGNELSLHELILFSIHQIGQLTPVATERQVADLLWGRITEKFRYQLKTDVEAGNP